MVVSHHRSWCMLGCLLGSCLAGSPGGWFPPPPAGQSCGTEGGYRYSSLYNLTALRVCTGPPRPERVCIVGGGSSGTHMGWLLRRRGFVNTILFDKNERLGGDVWTKPRAGDGNITRELGAAFLSPDYYEVRALLARYNQTDVPINVTDMIRIHPGGGAPTQHVSKWYNGWVSEFTNSSDPQVNAAAVSEALSRYLRLHSEIFGDYPGRFPPRPATPELLAAINGTILDFFERNDLTVLEPMFYQFFVLQGMGLLRTMPAYYVLKWLSPASIKAGGFGNDRDTPLAMLKDGYGAMIESMAEEVGLDVRLGVYVKKIVRMRSGHSTAMTPAVQLHLSDGTMEHCDLLVLSGPITTYVRGSDSGSVKPILEPPSSSEVNLFGPMHAMQFLIQLVEFESAPMGYEALEYWPDAFETLGGVIVRRDIGYAEQNATHRLGGIQSYSYWPAPACNKSMHLAKQARWLTDQGFSVAHTYAQPWFDTYLFHYPNSEDVMAGKPWEVDNIQLLPETSTLYVGGCASFETVEDSLNYNLELVDRFFDHQQPDERAKGPKGPSVAMAQQQGHIGVEKNTPVDSRAPADEDTPATEQLLFNATIPCDDVDRFVAVDAQVWTAFLLTQQGFTRKHVLMNPVKTETVSSIHQPQMCTVWSQIQWASRKLWKAIPSAQLASIAQQFAALFGSDPALSAFPADVDGQGLDTLLVVGDAPAQPYPPPQVSPNNPSQRESDRRLFTSYTSSSSISTTPSPQQPAMEVLLMSVPCASLQRYLDADNASFTKFLSTQAGFVQKRVMVDRNSGKASNTCSVWSNTWWASRAQWDAVIGSPGCKAAEKEFVHLYGSSVPMQRFPTAAGLDILLTTEAQPASKGGSTAMPAINGNDVVAYQFLHPGEKDVRGTPSIKRFIDSAPLLPTQAERSMHPGPYEFWFSSESNAALFDKDPWKYIPAFGGHCTHGISSRGDLNATLLVDGRVAFTCVNTTEWVVINGSLYMNSCGMYYDFIKDPQADIEAASKMWTGWFGAARRIGPINDACFQDGGRWGGDPVGHLIPPHCVINDQVQQQQLTLFQSEQGETVNRSSGQRIRVI